ncbi:MAG: hypothetical protein WC670_09155 [Pseudolabrys sp.]|jgi:hypothetical protein
MRLLLGIILGVLLTIGGAYLYDQSHAGVATADVTAGTADATGSRPMVNWDVVAVKWHDLTQGAKHQWDRVTSNIQSDRATRANEPRG